MTVGHGTQEVRAGGARHSLVRALLETTKENQCGSIVYHQFYSVAEKLHIINGLPLYIIIAKERFIHGYAVMIYATRVWQ